MTSSSQPRSDQPAKQTSLEPTLVDPQPTSSVDAEAVLAELARVFFESPSSAVSPTRHTIGPRESRDTAEAPLPQLEAKYQALVEQISAVIFMANLDEGIGEAYVSPQIEKSLGFTQEEWLEDPIRWYRQIHPDDKQRWSLEAAEMFLSGTTLRSAYRVIARDGRVVWFQCEAKMMRREDGRPWFIHGVGFDITELKQTELALQQERNVVSAILDTVGALVAVLDPGGRIVRFNRAFEQITGYTFSEVRDKYVWDLFMIPEEVGHFKEIFQHLREDKLQNEYESNWLTKDGRQRLIAWSSSALPESDGAPAYIIVTGIDITERKRLERLELERQASKTEQTLELLQRLIDSMSEALFLVDFEGRVTKTNRASSTLLERDQKQITGALLSDLIHNSEIPSTPAHLLALAPSGRLYLEMELHAAGGAVIASSISCSLVRDKGGEITGLLLVMKNISERKHAETALQRTEKLAAAGRLAASIAHEINNPLQAVTNMLFLARKHPGKTRRYLKLADHEVDRVIQIARQTLGFYRDTSMPVPIKLWKVWEDVLFLYARKIESRGIKVEVQYDKKAEIIGLAGEIRQVFSNLIINAVDAMAENGHLRLRVSRSRAWNSGAEGVRITVADDGSGIDSKNMKRLFEPFFTTKQEVGTGLGLWLTHSIIHRHGGFIRVRSRTEPGRSGTVFSVFLPRKAGLK